MNNQQKTEQTKEYVRILKLLIEELNSMQSFLSDIRTKKKFHNLDNLVIIYDRFFNNELLNKHIFYEKSFVVKSTHALFAHKKLNKDNAYYHLKLKIKSDELDFLDKLYDNIVSILLKFFKQLFSYIDNLDALHNVNKIRKYELFINKVKVRITNFVEKCEICSLLSWRSSL